jgi:hypothetical protein
VEVAVTLFHVTGQAVPGAPGTIHIPVETVDPLPVEGDVLVAIVDVTQAPPGMVDLEDFRAVLDLPEHLYPDSELLTVIDAATALVLAQLDPAKEPHTWHPWDREAVFTVAVDLWQARRAPGGTNAGPEWAPTTSPAMLGPALIMRVIGVLGPCLASGGAVIA